jgi:hypothetical protein
MWAASLTARKSRTVLCDWRCQQSRQGQRTYADNSSHQGALERRDGAEREQPSDWKLQDVAATWNPSDEFEGYAARKEVQDIPVSPSGLTSHQLSRGDMSLTQKRFLRNVR